MISIYGQFSFVLLSRPYWKYLHVVTSEEFRVHCSPAGAAYDKPKRSTILLPKMSTSVSFHRFLYFAADGASNITKQAPLEGKVGALSVSFYVFCCRRVFKYSQTGTTERKRPAL